MKKLMFQLLAALVGVCAYSQTSTKPASEWKATVKVLDEAGQPVAGARVEIWYYVQAPPGRSAAEEKTDRLTDTNGVCTAQHEYTGSADLGFRATKPGYYPTTKGHEFARFAEGDPAKWAPSIDLVLKKIGEPIPMYARRVDSGPPANGEPVGYDLATGDWVAPDGKGKTTDFVFLKEYSKRSLDDYDYRLIVSLPNPGDGIQEFRVPRTQFSADGSALRSPHEAPEQGYVAKVTRLNISHPGEPLVFDYDENRNYFFRVRTVLDEHGNVKSALYGKIYGDFMHFTYYLNPTPNDRNVEFDAKHNLLTGLKSFEQVTAP